MRALGVVFGLLGLIAVMLLPSVAAAKPAAAKKKATATKKAPPKKKAPRPVVKKEPKVYGPPKVIFTFDDGPAGDKTVKVLDLLDKHKIKAVFFVNGWHFQGTTKAAEREKNIVRDTLKRGHLVGNHTIHHYFLCGKVYVKKAESEIVDNAKLIEETIGVKPALYRTPFGAHCPPLAAVHSKINIKHTGWDLDPQDWKLKDKKKIEDTVIGQLKSMKGQNILLLHDVQPATVEALPRILDWLDEENASRKKQGLPEIEVLDPKVLLATAPPSPSPPAAAAAPVASPPPPPAPHP